MIIPDTGCAPAKPESIVYHGSKKNGIAAHYFQPEFAAGKCCINFVQYAFDIFQPFHALFFSHMDSVACRATWQISFVINQSLLYV